MEFRHYLQNELTRRSEKDPSYSLRSFARALKCDPSTLAKLIKGHRPLGPKLIRALSATLGLSPVEAQDFLKARKAKKRMNAVHHAKGELLSGTDDYQQLTLDQFKIIADWQHYAILELMRVDRFKPDPKWIAKALGISSLDVSMAVERLVRVELLEIVRDKRSKKLRWIDRSGGKSTNMQKAFLESAHRKLQLQILTQATRALENVPRSKRDQSAMTMAIDTERLDDAKELIKNFRRELAKFLSRGETRDQVYQLSISLFPITDAPERSKSP